MTALHVPAPSSDPRILEPLIQRARKLADVAALAHMSGLTLPEVVGVTNHKVLPDIEFNCDRATFDAWFGWLNATHCRDFPGSDFYTATAVTALRDLGPVSLRFSTLKRPA